MLTKITLKYQCLIKGFRCSLTANINRDQSLAFVNHVKYLTLLANLISGENQIPANLRPLSP